MMIAARNAMLMGGAKLPYDAEVDYLESTGTQYVDTLVAAAADISVEVDALPKNGIRYGETLYSGPLFGDISVSATALCFTAGAGNDFFVSAATIAIPSDKTNRQTVGMTRFVGTRTIGATTQSWNLSGSPVAAELSMYLFARRSATGPGFGTWQIYAAQISVGGALVRDYIPVRVGSDSSAVGYLYDRANPTGGPLGNGLYPNAGSGAFVVGPDKP